MLVAMTITAVTTTSTVYSGGEASPSVPLSVALTNTNAPAIGSAFQSLSSGANTITAPTGFTVSGVTVFPPAGNTTSLIVKGVTGDTGVRLHNTMASQIALDTSVASFVLAAGAAMTVRLAWW